MLPLDQLKASRSLPIGHVGIKAARQAVEKEYGMSNRVENHLRKRLGRQSLAHEQIAQFVGEIILAVSLPRIRRVVLSSPDVCSEASAHYWRSEIHFRHDYVSIETLLHEMAHHLQQVDKGWGYGHGRGFCEAVHFLYQIAESCFPKLFVRKSKNLTLDQMLLDKVK